MFNLSTSTSSTSSISTSLIYQGLAAFTSIFTQINKMDTFSKLSPPEAVRIKVRLVERLDDNLSMSSMSSNASSNLVASSNQSPTSVSSSRLSESIKFCVDPQRTSFDIIKTLISQAFHINEDFQMSYLNRDNPYTEFLALSCDFDLDAAFNTSSHPYLSINVQPSNSDLTEWDIINSIDYKSSKPESLLSRKKNSLETSTSSCRSGVSIMSMDPNGRSIIAVLSNQAANGATTFCQKILNSFSRSNSFTSSTKSEPVFNAGLPGVNFNVESPLKIQAKQPLGLAELKNFLDSDGRVVQPVELRQRIFDGGCEPHSRKDLWPILLNIYPTHSMTSKQRTEFIKRESLKYEQLKFDLWYGANKTLWKTNKSLINDVELDALANKIQKDVWRTDRSNRFYSGDSNKNIESLFNILMTYALDNGHFYAQGMSDLLSPLLYVLRNESMAFICFVALMKRCMDNFDINSETIASKISLLTLLLQRYDPKLFEYLKEVGAEQLLFTYRWLLIECKREFPFENSLTVLEVMWSSIVDQRSTIEKLSDSFYLALYKRSSSIDASSINTNERVDDAESDSSFVTSTSNSQKSRHQSQQSQISNGNNTNSNNNNNNNNTDEEHGSMCQVCMAEKSMVKNRHENINSNEKKFAIEEDEDYDDEDDDDESGCCSSSSTESRDLRERRKRRLSRNRRRYLSLNLDPPHKLRTGLCLQLKSQQMKEKNISLINSFQNTTLTTTSATKSTRTTTESPNFSNLKRSLSFCDCLNECGTKTPVEPSQKSNLRTSLSENSLVSNAENGIPIKPSKAIVTLSNTGLTLGSSVTAKFSTSEAETITLTNQLTQNCSFSPKSTHASWTHQNNNRILKRFNTFKLHHSHYNHNNNSNNNNNRSYHHKHNYNKLLRKKKYGSSQQQQQQNEASKRCSCTNSIFNSFSSMEEKLNEKKEKISTNKPQLNNKFNNSVNNKNNKSNSEQQQQQQVINNEFSLPLDSDLIDLLAKQDNPFHLFLCFSIFIEHRDHIMQAQMDANDIACYFDKMARMHNMKNILSRARYLHTELYLKRANAISYIQCLSEIQNSP